MKKIIKFEIVLLILLLIVAVGMTLVSRDILIVQEPVPVQRTPEPIPVDPQPEVVAEEMPTQPEEPQEEVALNLAAARYFAYDLREEEYIRTQGDVNEKLYPASITKLLTSHTVLQHMDPEDTVTVGDALTLVEADSSVADLQVGDVLTVEQLIAAMMLPSGNDAAQVAAVAAGRVIAGDETLPCTEAKQVFVRAMNVQAELLGMENSNFVNPDGWHNEDHYTTMNDLVILCREVLKNQTILKYTSRAEETVVLGDRELEWENTNFLLYEGGEAYVPSAIGLKTGYTEAAGGCLVSAFFETDRIILIGVFGGPGFTMDRYLDTVAIYNSL